MQAVISWFYYLLMFIKETKRRECRLGKEET